MEAGIITAVAVILVTLYYVYKYLKDAYNFWEKIGVPYIKPNFIFGNITDVLLLRTPLPLFYSQAYRNLNPHKFGGIYSCQSPALIVRDPELLKCILTKDFYHFQNRGFPDTRRVEPLAQHLFLLCGQEWKNLRIKLTTTFSTGKMKLMFPLINECAFRLETQLDQFANDNSDLDIKDILSRYTMDVIGSCAFGLEISSLENPDSEFQKFAKEVFKFRYPAVLRMIFPNIPEILIKYFGFTLVKKEVSDFFRRLVKETVEYRQKNHVIRNDFLGLLIQLRHEPCDEKALQEIDEVRYLEKVMPDDNEKSKAIDKFKKPTLE